MQFKTTDEARKWLRGIGSLKKDLKYKIQFYEELIEDSRKMGDKGNKYITHYLKQIDELQKQLQDVVPTVEKLFEGLSPDEKMVLTVKYLLNIGWNAVELYVYFSRRQAIRLHEQAIKKLVGRKVHERKKL